MDLSSGLSLYQQIKELALARLSNLGGIIVTRMIIALLLFFSSYIHATENLYRVAIVDKFYPPAEGFIDDEDRSTSNWMYGVFDLDRDREKEGYYHGDVVQIIANDPSFSFYTYPMRNGSAPMEEILTNLRKIHVRLATHHIDALVLSWESSTLISAFEKPLQLENAKQYKSQIRDWGHENPSWQATYKIILMLETLARQGVQIYTIAGNGGPGMVNTFSFADGVTTVGAIEPELANFVSDNPFVDLHAQAAYTISRIDDHLGRPLGYDVDGDNCPDIPLERLSNFNQQQDELPRQFWRPIKGSSFAAPMALKQELLKEKPSLPCAALVAAYP